MAPDLFSNKAWHAVSLAEVPFQSKNETSLCNIQSHLGWYSLKSEALSDTMY